jgi:hypothetical protein
VRTVVSTNFVFETDCTIPVLRIKAECAGLSGTVLTFPVRNVKLNSIPRSGNSIPKLENPITKLENSIPKPEKWVV